VDVKAIMAYGGKDATNLFPVQVSALCGGYTADGVSEAVTFDASNSTALDQNSVYHDFRYSTTDYRKDWYYEKMIELRANYLAGQRAYSSKLVKSLSFKKQI